MPWGVPFVIFGQFIILILLSVSPFWLSFLPIHPIHMATCYMYSIPHVQNEAEGAQLITREYSLYCHGRFISQATGEHTFYSKSNLGYGKACESAKSNALTRCCKDLGIASELWDPQVCVCVFVCMCVCMCMCAHAFTHTHSLGYRECISVC